MQVDLTRCKQEQALTNGLFTVAKCTETTSHLHYDMIKQKSS